MTVVGLRRQSFTISREIPAPQSGIKQLETAYKGMTFDWEGSPWTVHEDPTTGVRSPPPLPQATSVPHPVSHARSRCAWPYVSANTDLLVLCSRCTFTAQRGRSRSGRTHDFPAAKRKSGYVSTCTVTAVVPPAERSPDVRRLNSGCCCMQRRLTTSEKRLLAVIFVVPFTLLLAGIIGRVVYLQARHYCCSCHCKRPADAHLSRRHASAVFLSFSSS